MRNLKDNKAKKEERETDLSLRLKLQKRGMLTFRTSFQGFETLRPRPGRTGGRSGRAIKRDVEPTAEVKPKRNLPRFSTTQTKVDASPVLA